MRPSNRIWVEMPLERAWGLAARKFRSAGLGSGCCACRLRALLVLRLSGSDFHNQKNEISRNFFKRPIQPFFAPPGRIYPVMVCHPPEMVDAGVFYPERSLATGWGDR